MSSSKILPSVSVKSVAPSVDVNPRARTKNAAIWPRVTNSVGQNMSFSGGLQPRVMSSCASQEMSSWNMLLSGTSTNRSDAMPTGDVTTNTLDANATTRSAVKRFRILSLLLVTTGQGRPATQRTLTVVPVHSSGCPDGPGEGSRHLMQSLPCGCYGHLSDPDVRRPRVADSSETGRGDRRQDPDTRRGHDRDHVRRSRGGSRRSPDRGELAHRRLRCRRRPRRPHDDQSRPGRDCRRVGVRRGVPSVPGYWWNIERPAYAKIEALNEDGEEVVYEGEELMGRVLQHEYQHLEGTLIIDQLPRRERKKVLKELSEQALGL